MHVYCFMKQHITNKIAIIATFQMSLNYELIECTLKICYHLVQDFSIVQCHNFCELEDSCPMTLDVDNASYLTAFRP